MAIISVPAGGSIQAACNAAQPGDIISLAAGATYYETVSKSNKTVDIQGNGACISGAMPEFLSPGMWTNAGTAVGTLSGQTYTKWTAQYPTAYPFDPATNEYGSIRISGADDELWWHYDSLIDLQTHKNPVDNGEGYFVDVNGQICLISQTDPNTLPLYISKTSPPLRIAASTVNVSNLEVKHGARYGIYVTGGSTVNIDNVNAYNSGSNIAYLNSSTGTISNTKTASNYDINWPWEYMKGGRMEEFNILVASSDVDIISSEACRGFNGIGTVGTAILDIDDTIVSLMQDDAYEFEEDSTVTLKNSYAVDNFISLSSTPITAGGDVYVFNNLFVSNKTDWVRRYDWTTGVTTTWDGSIYKIYSDNSVVNQNLHVYNNTAYGPDAGFVFSVDRDGLIPLENMDWKNNIFHSTTSTVWANTGTAANNIDWDSNVFWSDAFAGASYTYINANNDNLGGSNSSSLAAQTLPASWTDNIEANPLLASPGTSTLDKAALTAAYTVSDTSPACDMTLCPIPANWPCAVEANESTCAGLARVIEVVCLDPIIPAVSNGQTTITNPNPTPMTVTITSGSATFQNPIPANTPVTATNITGGADGNFCVLGNC